VPEKHLKQTAKIS